VYTKCTIFVIFPTRDNLGQYERGTYFSFCSSYCHRHAQTLLMHPWGKFVRLFLPTTGVIGFGMLMFDRRRIRAYSRPGYFGSPLNRFRNSQRSNLQIHGYDCQRITLVKAWISILKVVDNPWNNMWGTSNFFLFRTV